MCSIDQLQKGISRKVSPYIKTMTFNSQMEKQEKLDTIHHVIINIKILPDAKAFIMMILRYSNLVYKD